MKQFGSKDVMRMESIKDKSKGDYIQEITHAYNMACAITDPGKAVARGNAAKEVFGEYSALAQIFYERAYELSGGYPVRPMASENSWDEDDDIEELFMDVPLDEQPASRRENYLKFNGTVKRKSPWTELISMGRLNTIKGTGTKMDLMRYKGGTLEVWKTDNDKYRLTYTSHYDPIYRINEKRNFKIDSRMETWEMVDYIKSIHSANLAPLYGKSIPIYKYY